MKTSELKTIASVADRVHELLKALHAEDPANPTFDQVGFLDGRSIVVDFIANNEAGLALEHLLYMVHESAVDVEAEDIRALHAIADEYALNRRYHAGDDS